MREQLWRYYPQFLVAIGDDIATPRGYGRGPRASAATRFRPATNRPGASTSPLPDRVRPLAEASGQTLNAGEVVCRLRDFRIVAGGHRIEQPRLCAVDVIGRALPHRLPGSVCPFQLSPPGSRRVPPRISRNSAESGGIPATNLPAAPDDQHPVSPRTSRRSTWSICRRA